MSGRPGSTFHSDGIARLSGRRSGYSNWIAYTSGFVVDGDKALIGFVGQRTSQDGGDSILIARLNDDGSLDQGFGDGGFVGRLSDSGTKSQITTLHLPSTPAVDSL